MNICKIIFKIRHKNPPGSSGSILFVRIGGKEARVRPLHALRPGASADFGTENEAGFLLVFPHFGGQESEKFGGRAPPLFFICVFSSIPFINEN